MKKLVYEVGIYDDTRVWTKGVGMERSYRAWVNILRRCYSRKYYKYRPAQKGSTICDEWKFYTKFKKWHEANYKEGFQLDRTIFDQNNKHHSPELCAYIPKDIKKIIRSVPAKKNGLPSGIHKNENGTFTARINMNRKQRNLGTYSTSEEAHYTYAQIRKKYLEDTAKSYFLNGDIDKEIFMALIERKVS